MLTSFLTNIIIQVPLPSSIAITSLDPYPLLVLCSVKCFAFLLSMDSRQRQPFPPLALMKGPFCSSSYNSFLHIKTMNKLSVKIQVSDSFLFFAVQEFHPCIYSVLIKSSPHSLPSSSSPAPQPPSLFIFKFTCSFYKPTESNQCSFYVHDKAIS